MPCTVLMARLAILVPDMRGGGAERVAITLAQGFLDRGHDVDLVLLDAQGELLDMVPRSVNVVDLKVRRMRQAIGPLVRYLRTRRPQAMQASMWPVTLIAILARGISRVPTRLVVSDHSSFSLQPGMNPWRVRLHGWLMRLFYPAADARITVTRALADDLARLSGLDSGQFVVVQNPVAIMPDTQVSNPKVEALWHGAGRRILSVGSLKPEKEHGLLLRAFARLHRSSPARLIIVGEGEKRRELEQLIDELGIGDAVALPGFVGDPAPFYASADLFVLSSSSEGMPLVLIEALAAGLPIVSTNCRSGPDEILAGGRYGELVPVGDVDQMALAMEKGLNANPDRRLLRDRAMDFRPEVAVNHYLKLMLG